MTTFTIQLAVKSCLRTVNARKIVQLQSIRHIRRNQVQRVQNLSTVSNLAKKMDRNIYYVSPETPFVFLDCVEAFNGLDEKEKRYAHHLSKASWKGALICLLQTSPESAGLFLLFQRIFRKQSVDELKSLAEGQGFTEDEVKALMSYIASVYGNMGNYKSFGDTKIFPDVPREKFVKLISSTAAINECEKTRDIWTIVEAKIFSDHSRHLQLGLGDDGISTYFSNNCNTSDAENVQTFLNSASISPYNTRLLRSESDGKHSYIVRQAAVETGSVTSGKCNSSAGQIDVTVEKGDYSPLMKAMVDELELAKEDALNDDQRNMLTSYIRSFSGGSIEDHKDGSRHWIKDRGPTVESYIGFIESYRDPYGVRGEFEGFVAVVNKAMSSKFQALVSKAETLLKLMPWDAEYEKDRFLKPDFTSLDIISFGSSGVPAGINIPNYDDIRQDEGFKNVSLGNVLKSRFKDPKVSFLSEEDRVRYVEHVGDAFEVQVGLHELLGHGSGKLFIQAEDGSFNIADKDNVPNMLTGGKGITSWYQPGETWDSKFTSLGSPYEECRAECVGLYLCGQPIVHEAFQIEGQRAKEIVYNNWLSMVRSGLLSLEMFTPSLGTWRQAHCQARYVILQVLVEAGEDFVKIDEFNGEDGKPDMRITIDESKIDSVGVPAIGNFLRKLQFYKSTADFEGGSAMFKQYSSVPERFVHLRGVAIARKKPRQEIVQCNTTRNGDGVTIATYDGTAEGMVKSFQDRFHDGLLEEELESMWRKDLNELGY